MVIGMIFGQAERWSGDGRDGGVRYKERKNGGGGENCGKKRKEGMEEEGN